MNKSFPLTKTVDDVQLFFDPTEHKYTDNRGNVYISTTTLIGEYEDKFDTKKMARICELAGLKGDPKYKGMSAKMLEAKWEKEKIEACDKGTVKHDHLEQAIKDSTGYRQNISKEFTGKRLLTVKDIIENPGFGELTLQYFIDTKINIIYPKIFAIISKLAAQGYRIYAEIAVYKHDTLMSGLIDLFFIKGKEFIILDWKTNKYPFTYVAGYWKKDEHGTPIYFLETHKTFKIPLQHLECSVGYKYALQLSDYAYLAELFGLTLKTIVLCHIRHEQEMNEELGYLVDQVDFHVIPYLKKEVISMINHYHSNRKLLGQSKMSF